MREPSPRAIAHDGPGRATLIRAIAARDSTVREHSRRLVGLGRRLGRRLGLSARRIASLELAAGLHDIGKIVVPAAVLFKPGRLTPDERRIIELHPEAGERICAAVESLRPTLPIIRHHHERLDGSGYPDGLRGEEIPLAARILQLVDIYDALTTHRPYRIALPPSRALGIMRQEVERGWWDPAIFDELVAMLAPAAVTQGPSRSTPWLAAPSRPTRRLATPVESAGPAH